MLTPEDINNANIALAKRNKSKRAAYTNYTPRRVDKNQRAIVKDFRTLGIQVTHLHAAGEGVFDLLCAYRWLVVSVEVKDYAKPPSKRAFTPAQVKWAQWWTGLKAVACNTADVLAIAQRMKDIVQGIGQTGVTPHIIGNPEAQYQS